MQLLIWKQWAAATAVYTMCVRTEHAGIAEDLGKCSLGIARSEVEHIPHLYIVLQADMVIWPLNSSRARRILVQDQTQRKQ